jgi:hypothetical protein
MFLVIHDVERDAESSADGCKRGENETVAAANDAAVALKMIRATFMRLFRRSLGQAPSGHFRSSRNSNRVK